MTGPGMPDLPDLMRHAPEPLDPVVAERLLAGAVVGGARRRRRRHLTTGLCGVAAVAVVATGTTALAAGGGPRGDDGVVGDAGAEVATSATTSATTDAAPSGSPTPTTSPTTYPTGSATEVPGGPVVPIDRRVRDDAGLAEVARRLLPAGSVVEEVTHIATSNPSHTADRTRRGRQVDAVVDGASASVVVQRWDGYAAVGLDLEPGESSPEALEDAPGSQRVATTAREACAGSYRLFPPEECTEAEGGWYSVSRPSQGAAMPDTYRELVVSFYTDDGYVVRVDSYNTPAEKSGPPVSEQPVLSAAESLALARSGDWFRP